MGSQKRFFLDRRWTPRQASDPSASQLDRTCNLLWQADLTASRTLKGDSTTAEENVSVRQAQCMRTGGVEEWNCCRLRITSREERAHKTSITH